MNQTICAYRPTRAQTSGCFENSPLPATSGDALRQHCPCAKLIRPAPGIQPPFPFWLGLPTEKIILRSVFGYGLLRPFKTHISHHLLMNRARRLRRRVISRNLQDLVRATTAAQNVITVSQTNWTWGRTHVRNQHGCTTRRLRTKGLSSISGPGARSPGRSHRGH